MRARVLVAGLGDVFLGDGGFGVEVVRGLLRARLPDGVTVKEVGVRPLHLASAMLERPELMLVVDVVRRGAEPGTVYLMDVTTQVGGLPHQIPATFGLNIDTVSAAVWTLRGKRPPILLIGCEPAFVGEQLGLSAPAVAALPKVEELVRTTLERWTGGETTQPMLIEGIAKSSQDGVWFPSLPG